MSISLSHPVPAVSGRRTELDLLLDQLDGMQAWTRRHRATGRLLEAASSGEARLNLFRRAEAVDRQRNALVDWTAQQLRESAVPLCSLSARRAVIVHRSDWFKDKISSGLQAGGIEVVARLENGADAIGVVVAEQPDVLLIEDRLPMVSGLLVTQAARQYAPRTMVIVQVAADWEIGPFLDAGATTAYSRRTSPIEIAAQLSTLVAI